ncbi:ATP-binding protein [Burkholderia vietnamiensis]|uniref:ATP-binding protein n=1 Tax=Burkholderia vietnamiensis TaxID=60552 RepID=UPI001BA15D5D|nr:ATP-binding protein [Burkholderia vietnamiensis]MBR8051433.1 PAS domain-containing protein [Burkholderia vietnamiensis]
MASNRSNPPKPTAKRRAAPGADALSHAAAGPDARPDAEGLDDAAWLEVIHKMDEVYSQLVQDEIALEEKNAQLEQSQQFILGLLSSMSDVLAACNARGEVEETNAAMCELLGQPDSVLRGSRFESWLADDASVTALRAVTASGTPAQGTVVELNMRDRQGAAVPVDFSCTPRGGPRGRRLGYLLVGRPTGELKRAYRQLREAHDALKHAQQQLLHSEKMAALGRLVAGVAHELNNPISFVLGNVHVLKRYGERLTRFIDATAQPLSAAERTRLRTELRIDPILADLPSLVDGMVEGAQRTADIVSALRRFSAVDREELGAVDINEVVTRAIHWIRKGAGPDFDVHWSPGEPQLVHGSAGQLLQVMMNLIQNACDAASSAHRGTPEIWIDATHRDDQVIVTVRDNGTGIMDEHLPHVFEPFFTTKPQGRGTGLGLSISYGIVDRHGGTLTAGNAEQGGAIFTLALPQS